MCISYYNAVLSTSLFSFCQTETDVSDSYFDGHIRGYIILPNVFFVFL